MELAPAMSRQERVGWEAQDSVVALVGQANLLAAQLVDVSPLVQLELIRSAFPGGILTAS